MKVFLDLAPNKHHTLYDELINYPPHGVEYKLPSENIYWTHIYALFQSFSGHLLFKKIYPNLRNIYYLIDGAKGSVHKMSKEEVKADLVHVCNVLAPREKPWVMDLDTVLSFTAGSMRIFRVHKKKIEKALSSKCCKKIMPWTNAGKRTLEKSLETKNFRNKIEVVHPAIHAVPRKQKREKDRVGLLFMGSLTNPETFINKGGEYALKCFEILSKKYDVTLVVRSKVPDEIKKRYRALKGLVLVENLLSRDELFNLYTKSDVALLPGHFYSLMATLESMTFGLPIVSIDGWANSEFIEQGRTGFLVKPSKHVPIVDGISPGWIPEFWRGVKIVDPRVVNDLVKYLSILIEDSFLRRKMGKRAIRRVTDGDLSIKVRNQKLREIYEEAIRR